MASPSPRAQADAQALTRQAEDYLKVIYEIERNGDAAGTTLTLDTEGPDMGTPGRIAPYQDIIGLDAEGNRTLTSRMQDADGVWREIIFARYRRAG